MRVLVINGPNINLLGIREPKIYGRETYADLERYVISAGQEMGVQADVWQSNHEGEIVGHIQEALGNYDGLVINPAAYTHTSIAILDALKAVALPVVEVHLSDPLTREEFRHVSYAGMACFASVRGQGFAGYAKALRLLKDRLLRDGASQ